MFLSVLVYLCVCVRVYGETPLIFCYKHTLKKTKTQSQTKKMEVSPGRRCQTRSRSSAAAARRRRRRNAANETAKKVVESPANRVPVVLLPSWTYSPPPPLPPQMTRVGSFTLAHTFFFSFPCSYIFFFQQENVKELTDTRSPFLVSSRRANQQKPYFYLNIGATSTHAFYIYSFFHFTFAPSPYSFPFFFFYIFLFRKKKNSPFALFLIVIKG